VILSDEQVGGAVVIVVSGDDGTRVFELNLVEAYVGSDVFESVRTKIAKELYFALSLFRFAHSDEINPSVIVEVEGGDAVGALPISLRQRNSLETLGMIVSRNGKAAWSTACHGDIHPTIMIDVEYRNAGNKRRRGGPRVP